MLFDRFGIARERRRRQVAADRRRRRRRRLDRDPARAHAHQADGDRDRVAAGDAEPGAGSSARITWSIIASRWRSSSTAIGHRFVDYIFGVTAIRPALRHDRRGDRAAGQVRPDRRSEAVRRRQAQGQERLAALGRRCSPARPSRRPTWTRSTSCSTRSRDMVDAGTIRTTVAENLRPHQRREPAPRPRHGRKRPHARQDRAGRVCTSVAKVAEQRQVSDAAQAALCFCCLKKASARFASSCGVTSSLCVAIIQLLPDGSFTPPQRSP